MRLNDARANADSDRVIPRSASRIARTVAISALLSLVGPAAGAHAASVPVGAQYVPPASQVIPPPGFRLSARQAIAVADGIPSVARERVRHARLTARALI